MRFNSFIFYCFLGLGLGFGFSCGTTEVETQDPLLPPTPLHSVCIVICDFSSSLDARARDLVKLNAQTIYKNLYKTHLILFYPISSNGYSAPIFKSSIYSNKNNSAQLVHKNISEVDSWNRAASDGFIDTLRQIERDPSYTSSCILTTIDCIKREANNLFQQGYDDIKIIYLSDMEEDCNSAYGKFRTSGSQFNELAKTLDENKINTPALCKAQCAITVSSTETLNANSFESFWRATFKKMGYNSDIYISSSLPMWAK